MPRVIGLFPALLLLIAAPAFAARVRQGLPDLFEAIDPSATNALLDELRKADPKARDASQVSLNEGDLGSAVSALQAAGVDISEEFLDAASNLEAPNAIGGNDTPDAIVGGPDDAAAGDVSDASGDVTGKDSGEKKEEMEEEKKEAKGPGFSPLEDEDETKEDDDDDSRSSIFSLSLQIHSLEMNCI